MRFALLLSFAALAPQLAMASAAMDMPALGLPLVRRQDEPTTTAAARESNQDSKDSQQSDSKDSNGSDSKDSKDSKNNNDSNDKNDKSDEGDDGEEPATATKKKKFDPRLPVGGLSMVTPDPKLGQTYIKLGHEFTFVWNYTSIKSPPQAVDVLAVVTTDLFTRTFTLTQNMSYDATQTFEYDTRNTEDAVGQVLLTAEYTLLVYDSAEGPDAAGQAGYLGPWKQFYFGMYTPRPYKPLADFECPTCMNSDAPLRVQALAFVLAMAGVTVLSFTMFAASFGVF